MRSYAVLLLVFAGCGGCADEVEVDFFEPRTYGTYEFEPAPDIRVPALVDFGIVPVGESRGREIVVENVGRLYLEIDQVEVSPPRPFPLRSAWLGGLQSGESSRELAEFVPESSAAARATVRIHSNDPDEPISRVVLIGNTTQPCVGSFEPGAPVWQVHEGEGPLCFRDEARYHGDPAEYDYATIPSPDDEGWRSEPDNRISFERRSSLCGSECRCRNGGDFTYFQTFLVIPEGAAVGVYRVDIGAVDDGARVTVFNDRFPAGVTDPGSYARLPGGSTADLAPYLGSGVNRLVITHVDDCCSISSIRNVAVSVDGVDVGSCDR